MGSLLAASNLGDLLLLHVLHLTDLVFGGLLGGRLWCLSTLAALHHCQTLVQHSEPNAERRSEWPNSPAPAVKLASCYY